MKLDTEHGADYFRALTCPDSNHIIPYSKPPDPSANTSFLVESFVDTAVYVELPLTLTSHL